MEAPLLILAVLAAAPQGAAPVATAPPAAAHAPAPLPPPAAAAPAPLPSAWHGRWAGPASSEGGPATRRFQMELLVAAGADPAKLGWTIVYVDGQNRQERRYTLLAVDAAQGELAIDEGNGIVLPTRRLGDSLWSAFAIDGTMLVASYRLDRGDDRTADDDSITVEIATMPVAATGATGGAGGAPAVATFAVRSLQRAVLTRLASSAPSTTDPAAPPPPQPPLGR